jgi:alpha-L-fucosidase
MFIHWGLYSVPAGIWHGKKATHPYAEWLQASEHEE